MRKLIVLMQTTLDGRISQADSEPRTQCGTITGSPRTCASPSDFI